MASLGIRNVLMALSEGVSMTNVLLQFHDVPFSSSSGTGWKSKASARKENDSVAPLMLVVTWMRLVNSFMCYDVNVGCWTKVVGWLALNIIKSVRFLVFSCFFLMDSVSVSLIILEKRVVRDVFLQSVSQYEVVHHLLCRPLPSSFLVLQEYAV